MVKTPPTDEVFMAERLHEPETSGVFPSMELRAQPRDAAQRRVDLSGPDGFDRFFASEHERLFGTLCLVTRDRAEAEDVSQEAFLRVYQRWRVVAEHENPPGYLYRTAFNLLRNRRRQAMRAAKRLVAPDPPSDSFDAVEIRDELAAAMRTLSPRQRAALVLTELLDYPSAEAAQLLGVRPATVRVLASQGRARLKAVLQEAPDV